MKSVVVSTQTLTREEQWEVFEKLPLTKEQKSRLLATLAKESEEKTDSEQKVEEKDESEQKVTGSASSGEKSRIP